MLQGPKPDPQKKQKAQALTFLGLTFLICQSKALHQTLGFSHGVLGLREETLNPLTTSVRLLASAFLCISC